jgi:VacB/RNase II family 3'-5' exoribonuclease
VGAGAGLHSVAAARPSRYVLGMRKWSQEQLRAIARRAMEERGFLPSFSAAAEAEAEALSGPARDPDPKIRDLRGQLWCSIDNDDSRDLDQLTVSEEGTGGAVRIRVAVADVDATVRKGSAIDGHARTNTTSVYTPVGVFPMLPERLSTDLTSLGPGQERLAVVIDMAIGADGVPGAAEIYRARVLNRAKLAYDSVAAWLDGGTPPPALAAVPGLETQLRLQDHVAQSMKDTRHQRGALTLASTEARAVFVGEELTDLRPEEKNRAKELIEEFMVAANSCVARFLDQKGFPSLRRLLRSPQRWERIVGLARELGERLPEEPDAVPLQQFLLRRQQADPVRFPDLSLSVIKLLGSGEYGLEWPGQSSEGHFGLALRDYTHSTAPNRRFPDLITQRLLKAALRSGPLPYARDELEALTRHCTEQEDDAVKIERRVRKSVAAALLSSRIGQRFEGIVTGASAKGTWVRIRHPSAEGRVVRGFEGLDVGDRATVRLVRADVERGYIDFEG